MSPAQWAMFDSVLSDPDIRTLLVCAEIPLITDHPADAMQKIKGNAFFQFQSIPSFFVLFFSFFFVK